jgi:hypothetical protein
MGALAAMGLVLALRIAGDGRRGAPARALAAAAAAPLGAAGLLTVLARLPAGRRGRSRRALRAASLASAAAGDRARARGGGRRGRGGRAAAGRGHARRLGFRAIGAGGAAARLAARARGGRGRVAWREDASDAPHRVPRRAVAGAAAMVALLLALGAIVDFGSSRAPADGATAARLGSTDSNRFVYWKVAAGAFADHPLRGLGGGGFESVWLRERTIPDKARDAHGLAIETAAELGLLGLFCLGLAAAGIAFATRNALARDRVLAAGPASALAAWALHAQIDWDWEMPALTLVAMVLAGMLVAAGEAPGPARSGPERVKRMALLAGFAVGGGAAGRLAALGGPHGARDRACPGRRLPRRAEARAGPRSAAASGSLEPRSQPRGPRRRPADPPRAGARGRGRTRARRAGGAGERRGLAAAVRRAALERSRALSAS